jgi:CSLREA domain-containing protein
MGERLLQHATRSLGACAISACLLAAASSARAAEFKVTSTADTSECTSTCTLRGAIEAADSSSDASDTITVPAGVYNLRPAEKADPTHAGQLRLTNGPATIVTIAGAGVGETVIDAGKGDRVMRAAGGGTDVLAGMTLEGGYPSAEDNAFEESVRGAGILQFGGTLTLERVRVTENEDNGYGGGIDVEASGKLNLLESELDHDLADDAGGGAVNLEPGTLLATGTTFDDDNSPAATGGAAQLLKGSNATFTNDTFADDGFVPFGDTYEGGAVYLEGATAAFNDVTFAGNGAFGNFEGGADISANEGSHVTLTNSVLGAGREEEPGEAECNEAFKSRVSAWSDLGGNLSGDESCHLAAADMGVALRLGALGSYGGPTQTVPLLEGSPAIDNGVPGCPANDQRGYARVDKCDSGSFEFDATAPTPKTEGSPPPPSESPKQQQPGPTVLPPSSGPSAAEVERVLLGCGTSKLVLNDVYRRGNRVVISGSAAKRLVAEHVRILLDGRRQVATALVQPDGQYTTTAPLPHGGLKDRVNARYTAAIGMLDSLSLKLTRRLELDAPTALGTQVTLTGQIVGPLTRPIAPVAVEQELECGRATIAKTFTPSASGRYHLTLALPAGTRAAIFRLSTSVAANARSLRHGFATFSLPLPVVLG